MLGFGSVLLPPGTLLTCLAYLTTDPATYFGTFDTFPVHTESHNTHRHTDTRTRAHTHTRTHAAHTHASTETRLRTLLLCKTLGQIGHGGIGRKGVRDEEGRPFSS